jgi:subtilase family serine protease
LQKDYAKVIAAQLSHSVSIMKKTKHPLNLNFTSYDGVIKKECENMGAKKWIFNTEEKPFYELYDE